ncbi:hypothetical protein DL95DRAFT_452628 [Leptodontidium sp. 2 PMI_412]|nr:hypothetical protein DL95DRAFT_452628 [Leptodontidium sp. 2 PMI_412]
MKISITALLVSTLSCTVMGAALPEGNGVSTVAAQPLPAANLDYFQETQKKWLEVLETAVVAKRTENNQLEERQVPGTGGAEQWAAASRALDNARSNSAQDVQRRRLQQTVEGKCTGANRNACERCMDGAEATVIGEIIECGTVALGVAAFTPGTAGLAAFLAAAGFIACDIAAAGRVASAWSNCVRIAP